MKNCRKFIVSALAVMACSTSAMAITVDGNLSDWGINKATFVPSAGIEYTVEDGYRLSDGFLSPGWGGQNYDAEALYAVIQGGNLYIALITGHNPLSGSWAAGDFAIDFGRDNTFEVGVNFKAPNNIGSQFGVHGGVYTNVDWAYGIWDSTGGHVGLNSPNVDKTHPTHIISGTKTGDATLAYTTSPETGYGTSQSEGHYFYEMSIPVELLMNPDWINKAFDIHWTMDCANDSIEVDPDFKIPEPGSMLLLGIALFGLAGLRRRQRS